MNCSNLNWSPKTLLGLALAALMVAGITLTTSADDSATEWKAPARASRKANPNPADAKSIAAGQVVYAKNCLSCHGATGAGDGPSAKDLNPKPKDLTAAVVAAETDGALFWKITNGKKPMPAFEKLLSDDDRWNVVNYIRSLAPPAPGK